MKYLPKQTHRAGEVLETFEKKGKPYEKVIIICSRCGGDGNYSYNEVDGTICYGCQGSGVNIVERRILTEKEKEQREKAKQRREEKKEFERQQAEQEKENKIKEYIENNPIIYIAIDKDSYNKKDMLKQNGYKWLTWYWVGHKQVEEVETISVNTEEVINEYGNIVDTIINDKVREYKKSLEEPNNTKNEWYGSEGDKIEKEVTIEGRFGYDTQYGWVNITIMKDAEGYTYKWSSKNYLGEKGTKKNIKATIKDHEEYKGQKQTVLTRVKAL